MVIQWPKDDLTNCQLIINGQESIVLTNEPIDLTFAPGKHSIQILREGYDPIVSQFEAKPDDLRTLTVTWNKIEKSFKAAKNS